MDNVDWDLFAIVRSCKATSLTPSTIFESSPQTPTTTTTTTTTTMNKVISLQNYTPSYFDDFTMSYENSPIPFSPLKSNDFLQLGRFIPNFNPNTTISAVVTPVTTTTTFMTPNSTFASPSILNINGTNQYSNICRFPKPAPYIEITTGHFDLAYNHPSVLHELQRERNQLPIQAPKTSFGLIPNTLSQHPKRKSWKRKNNNTKILECHLSVEKIKEDPWTWRKYGEKIIKGSSHPRSYYKCSSFKDCSAKKLVEKSKNKENTYVVTYKGQHNHKEPKYNHKSVIGTSQNKLSKRILSTAKVVRNMNSPNVVMTHFNQTGNINAQILSTQSKVIYPENELTKNHLLVSQEAVSSSSVGNLSSSDVMMSQFDEPKGNDAQVFTCESTIPYSQKKSSGSCDDDDHDILIPNMRAMSEDILLDFNHLNGGRLFT
ncbi:unnamed protein product [Lathyrus sativus]|nr:unnamed protein product [Lathyrus sativus]